jgi:PKD repeat protein
MRKGSSIGLAMLAVLTASAACTVQETEIPPLAGPSEFALSVSVDANPASITQDGASQSAIVVTARGVDGQPLSGQVFRLDIVVDGVPVDYGQLSGRTVVTGSDGRANAVYTAPPPLPTNAQPETCQPAIFSPSLPGGCVNIVATPIGMNFETVSGRHVQIHLMPAGVILPPQPTPVPTITVTPTPVNLNVPATFTGSATCDGAPCTGTLTYAWNFGDGTTAQGQSVTKTFSTAGTHQVTLTVTPERGAPGSTTLAVTVTASAAPTASFVVSPTPVTVGVVTNFNATASRAAAGRTIVDYNWNFGDGSAGIGGISAAVVTHTFTAPGTYVVVLIVRDDAGQATTVTSNVTVTP